ncbi:MAG: protease inhibitor I42 family protein [bacterium]
MWENGKNFIRMLILSIFILAHSIFFPIKVSTQYPNPAYNNQGNYPYQQINTPIYAQNIYNPYNPSLYNPSQFPFQYNPYDLAPSGLTNQTGFSYNQYIQNPHYYPYAQTTNQYYTQTYTAQNAYMQNPYNQNPYLPGGYQQNLYTSAPYYQDPYARSPYQVSYAPDYYNQSAFTPPLSQSYPIAYNQTPPVTPPPPLTNPFQEYASFLITDVSIDETSSGQRINLAEGETLSILLASTGSQWELKVDELDKDIVEKLENSYYSSSTGYAGAGGYEQWLFRAEAVGTTTIKFGHTSLLNSSSREKAFEVEIIVY